MYYLTLQNVESIIKQINKRYNMDVTITNKGQLEFALEKPKTKLFGNEQYPELYQKAAVLMETITKLHTLSDGNKRTAMMAAEFMIKANGGELVLPLKTIRLSVDTAMDETDSMSKLIQQWFKVHIAMNVHQLCVILYEHIEEETIIKKLWGDQKYREVDNLIGKWMAFDSYPENRKAWNELTKQWQESQISIDKKSSINPEKFGWFEMWGSIMGIAKQAHEQYTDYFIVPVEKITDLRCYNITMKELTNMEDEIKKSAKIYEKTTDPGVIHENGMILARHRNYSEAISQFEKLRKYAKDESDAVLHIADILYYNIEDPKSALDYFRIFEKYDPKSLYVLRHIGFVLTELKQYSDALNYLENTLIEKEDPEKIILFKGICYDELKEYDKAIQCYEKCISLNSKNAEAYARLAIVYTEKDQLEKSLEYHKKTIQLVPDDYKVYYNKGRTLHLFGKDDEAIIEYKKSLELEPNNIRSIINMGSVISDSGKREDAIPFFQKGLEQDPNHPIALASLGLTLIFLRRFNDALQQVNRLLQLEPNNYHAKMSKAVIFANTGKILESLELLEEVIRNKPEYKEDLIENSDGLLNPIIDSERFKKLIQ